MERPELRVHVVQDTDVDERVECALLAFFAWRGLGDVYLRAVRPSFRERPAFVAVASDADWPPPDGATDPIEGVVHCAPHDGAAVRLTPIYVAGRRSTDLGLMAALYKTGLETALSVGMELVRYSLPQGSGALLYAFEQRGFAPVDPVEGESLVDVEGRIEEVLGRLGLDGTPIGELLGPDFGRGAGHDAIACFQSMLQLGGIRRPPGVVGNPVGSEPGTPGPVDPPDPSPGPDGGTVGSEPGTP